MLTNFIMYWRKLKLFLKRVLFNQRPKISLLIPFSTKDPIRKRNFKWLLEYWQAQLPDAEIIIGHSKSKIFCKGEALNDAVSRSTGKVLVILDADAYLSGDTISRCADRILEELEYGNHLWYVPYRSLWRLTRETTEQIIHNHKAYEAPNLDDFTPFPYQVEGDGTKAKYGHRYGAMIMMFPRQAYELIGCFDERFKGWGGEDVALLRALDTLWGKHKTLNINIHHLWHPYIGGNYQERRWEGQEYGSVNSRLAIKYHQATRKPTEMWKLINGAWWYKYGRNYPMK